MTVVNKYIDKMYEIYINDFHQILPNIFQYDRSHANILEISFAEV